MAAQAGPPANGQTVLTIARRGRFWVGEPLFYRGEQVPLAKGRVKPVEGRIALCRVDRRRGQPIADLGRADRARDVVSALLAERGLRPTFHKRLESEAAAAVERVEAEALSRRDLTAEPTFTVDPKTARDFDDAVSARREDGGFRLWIHIADVAAHVRPESGLDSEARERANSTYAPGIVSPMLPGKLSNDACSLNPGVVRPAVTAEIRLSDAAEVRGADFYRSLIRSDVRLDYEGLDRIFAGRDRAPEPVAEPIRIAREAAAALAALSAGRSLVVHSPEPEFEFGQGGEVLSAHSVPQTESHRLIEKLMILTNEQVALLLERKRVPALYRVHEQPDPGRVEEMLKRLAALDVPTPPVPEGLSPSEAGELAVAASELIAKEAKRRGSGSASLSPLVLRALKPARYSPENLGHAGLGSPAYAHFTSPIRRYPDLIVHRALLAVLGADEDPPDRHEVAAAAEHCSETERDSMRVERDGDDICLAFLLQRELRESGPDQHFKGEVSGVIGAGAFVRFVGEMADVYEGFLPARRIPGDRYNLDETESVLVGSRSGTKVRIGDPIEIAVEKIDAPRGRVDLLPGAGKPGRAGDSKGARGGKSSGKGRAKGGGKQGKGKSKPQRQGKPKGRKQGKGQSQKQAKGKSKGGTGAKRKGRR